jgi:hypothetical protein
MSDSTKPIVSTSKTSATVAAMQAGRKAASANRASLPAISPVSKMAIQQARAASRVCKLVVKFLESGEAVSPEVMRACGQLVMVGSELIAG